MECVFSVIIAAILGGAVVATLLVKLISLQRTIDNLLRARALLQGEARRMGSAIDGELLQKLEAQVKKF